MSQILFAVDDESTRSLLAVTFHKLPVQERTHIKSIIAAVTDADLTTAIRPFSFGGKVVHELYFDPAKMLFFDRQEKIGAVVSAFIISCLAQNGHVPLSDQTLRTHTKMIMRYAKRLKYGAEVSAFLRRYTALEDEWRHNSFPNLPDDCDS